MSAGKASHSKTGRPADSRLFWLHPATHQSDTGNSTCRYE